MAVKVAVMEVRDRGWPWSFGRAFYRWTRWLLCLPRKCNHHNSRETGIPILMRIPLDREIGVGIAQGNKTLIEIYPKYLDEFQQIFTLICDRVVPDA